MITNPLLFAIICMLVGFLLAFSIVGILLTYLIYDHKRDDKGDDFYEP